MSSGSEKLWQSVLAGILVANAGTVFGQTPQHPVLMSQPGYAGAYQQPYYPPQPYYTPQPQFIAPQPYGAQPTFQQSNQYEPWTPTGSPSAGYAPYGPGQYSASQYNSGMSAPMTQDRQCYRTQSTMASRESSNCDWCRPTGSAPRWTETECDCPAAPLGASLAAFRNVMRTERHNVSMILYRYDFVDDSEQLNARGRSRLAELIALSATNAASLTIEDVREDPRLAMLRRETVLSELMRRSSGISPDRVVIRSADWPQLRGEESELIRHRQLKQTTNGGPGSLGSATRSIR